MESREGRVVRMADDALMAVLRERLAFVREAWVEKAKKRGVVGPEAIANELRATVKSLR